MTTVVTQNGSVRGSESQGLSIFKGIPFAAPPIGRDRWGPPRPVEAWEGTLDATSFGRQALQTVSPLTAMFGGVQEQIAFGEDCLTLNIWTAGCDDARRPVMVWIHGGAFVIGSGSSPTRIFGPERSTITPTGRPTFSEASRMAAIAAR